MKPYFAKELPVPCPQLEKQPDGSSCNKNNNCEHPKCTKKLSLCSRDVKVGDNFNYTTPDNHILGQTATEDTIEALKTLKLPYWKVIGEISPQALWVKEGDEWDEDEVRVCGQQILVDKETFNSDPRSWTEAEYKVVFVGKIKGPCGHFH